MMGLCWGILEPVMAFQTYKLCWFESGIDLVLQTIPNHEGDNIE